MRSRALLLMIMPLIGMIGCNRDNGAAKTATPAAPAAPSAPAAPAATVVPVVVTDFRPSTQIKPGIGFREATLRRGALPMKVWLYAPEKATSKLPLVLVPPAGSTLFAGMDLGDGDRAEHFPYAQAGFAVASFEIDGNVPRGSSNAATIEGAKLFRDSKAGLENAKAALDFVLEKEPNIDRERIYVAGHSSAGTLALLVAEHDPRIKACIAYASVTDVVTDLGPAVAAVDRAILGYRDFFRQSSPKTHASKLTCPVFLFCAKDDSTVPPNQTTDFATQLKSSNSAVTVEVVPSGGHYQSMIKDGIPKGIAWLRKLPATK
jgi:dipeptidyl aminopeptidase/acylaminoacyl peptidase